MVLVVALSFGCGTSDTEPVDAGTFSSEDADTLQSNDASVLKAHENGRSTSAARQTARLLGGDDSAPNGYYEYLPPDYHIVASAPLIIFWSGSGQNGNGTTDLARMLVHGPPKLIQANEWPDERPFIVLSPQHVGDACVRGPEVHAFLTWALAHYKIDPNRIYLTGLSCGADGSWDYLASYHGRVAAAVLISGDPGDPTRAGSVWQRGRCALGDSAIWSLHGDRDRDYPVDRDTTNDVINCPKSTRRSAIFTTVVGGAHEIWGPIYDLSSGYGDIYAWMLQQGKP